MSGTQSATSGEKENQGWRHLARGRSRTSAIASITAAVLSGVMIVLASADFDIWPLAYVALVPCMWVVATAPTRRRALLWGWLTGLATNAIGFYWLTELLTRHGGLPWSLAVLGLLALSAYQALVFLLFAWSVRGIRLFSTEALGRPLPMVMIAPLAMVTFELLIPFIFPWYLAITQAWVTPVIQIVELTGPLGVTFVIMAVNGAVFDVLLDSDRRRRIMSIAGAGVLVASMLVFGYVRMGTIDARRDDAPRLRVGLVQSNIPLDRRYARNPDDVLRDLQDVSIGLEQQGAALIVWPESSFPYAVSRHQRQDADAPEHSIRRDLSVPLVLGALTLDTQDADAIPYNSAILIDANGSFVGMYDKIYRLMFGEYIPFVETFPFIRDLLPSTAGHLAKGEGVETFPFVHQGMDYRLGPLICYEDILPAFGRQLAARHPHLLVNITNDTWFGDTAEPWQHLALSVFRAVEARTDLVRAVNTGVSAHIDATGRVRASSYVIDPVRTPRKPTGLLADAALIEGGHTVYVHIGDAFGYACALALLGLWLGWPAWWRRRSMAMATPEP